MYSILSIIHYQLLTARMSPHILSHQLKADKPVQKIPSLPQSTLISTESHQTNNSKPWFLLKDNKPGY